MKEKPTRNTGTITETTKEDYPKLIVERGEVYFFDKERSELIKLKEYRIGKERNRENPVTIGREDPETIGKNDILIDKRYQSVSRHHTEIYFDENENSYFLVDHSLNGTCVNGENVGGKRVGVRRTLKHNDLIEIPAGERHIKIRFLMQERKGIVDWSGIRG